MTMGLWDLPDEDYRNGDPTEEDCGICGENITTADEVGEFVLQRYEIERLEDGSLKRTDIRESVVAHAQCGLDHGLELA